MAFKGGTSLSKVHGIIDQFSEDVGITHYISHWVLQFMQPYHFR